MTALPALLFYPCVMMLAALGDLRTMRIPNRLVLVLLLGYVAMLPLSGLGLRDVAESVAAAMVVLAAGLAAFAFRWMGGGDVKLMAVAALWLGAAQVPAFVIATVVIGALLTAVFLVLRTVPLPVSWGERDWVRRLHAPETGIPYGVAIAAAGVLVFFGTPWVSGP